MKLASLKDDDGFVALFKRLVSNAKEVVVFDPDANPAKAETDLYFYFPCDNQKHVDCGFFVWVVAISTADILFRDIEALRDDNNMTEAEVIEMTSEENFRVFNIITTKPFVRDDLPYIASRWLAEWVEELKDVPIRLADHFEYSRRFAIYEEYHLDPEHVDLFHLEMRGVMTQEFYFQGKLMSKEEYFQALHELMERQKNKDDEPGDDHGGYL